MNTLSVGTEAGLLAPTWAGTPAAAEVTDEAWLQAMLDVEVALARAQCAVGLTPAATVETIASASRVRRLDLVALAHAARAAANPVVALVTAFTEVVAEEDPAAAEYVHRGSTSQDILDSAAMVIGRRVLGPDRGGPLPGGRRARLPGRHPPPYAPRRPHPGPARRADDPRAEGGGVAGAGRRRGGAGAGGGVRASGAIGGSGWDVGRVPGVRGGGSWGATAGRTSRRRPRRGRSGTARALLLGPRSRRAHPPLAHRPHARRGTRGRPPSRHRGAREVRAGCADAVPYRDR